MCFKDLFIRVLLASVIKFFGSEMSMDFELSPGLEIGVDVVAELDGIKRPRKSISNRNQPTRLERVITRSVSRAIALNQSPSPVLAKPFQDFISHNKQEQDAESKKIMSTIEKLYPERSFELVHKRLIVEDGCLMKIEKVPGFYYSQEMQSIKRRLKF